jgi:CRISPR-associated protein Cst2
MAFLTGMIILDAPASALNNAGAEDGARTDNTVAVKKIRAHDGVYPYVSAQAFRYWLRTTLEHSEDQWKAAPVFREKKIAFSESDPITNWDDDLFGYMRAQSKKGDADEKKDNESKTKGAAPLEKDREITRVSPLRVSTFVSIAPATIVDDFGTMSRQDGDPVPHEHQFYRAHLRGLLSLDLTSAGTFYDCERTGFKNLDSYRREKASAQGAIEANVRGQDAFRLPIEQRKNRVSTLMRGLMNLAGGAKQTLHYTDLTPAVVVFAVTQGGNHPFYRMFTGNRNEGTRLHEAATTEILTAFRSELLSQVYVGWAHGFLDAERDRFEKLMEKCDAETRGRVRPVAHPRSVLQEISELLSQAEADSWYD